MAGGVLYDVTKSNIEILATPVALSSIVFDPASGAFLQYVAMRIIEQFLTQVFTNLYNFDMEEWLVMCSKNFVRTACRQMSARPVILHIQ